MDDLRACMRPEVINFKVGRRQGQGGSARIKPSTPLFKALWAGDPGAIALARGRPSTEGILARSIARAWGNAATDLEDVPVVMLPFPIWHRPFADAQGLPAAAGSRANLRFPGPLPDWPPSDSPCWDHCKGLPSAPESAPAAVAPGKFSASALVSLISRARGWAPSVMNAAADSEGAKAHLEDFVQTLDAWKTEWQEATGEVRASKGLGRFRHTAGKVVQCLRFANHLRGGANEVHQLLLDAVCLAVPPPVAGPSLAHLLAMHSYVKPSIW